MPGSRSESFCLQFCRSAVGINFADELMQALQFCIGKRQQPPEQPLKRLQPSRSQRVALLFIEIIRHLCNGPPLEAKDGCGVEHAPLQLAIWLALWGHLDALHARQSNLINPLGRKDALEPHLQRLQITAAHRSSFRIEERVLVSFHLSRAFSNLLVEASV